MVRLQGQGESVIQGFGLVIGLPGTGDSGKDLVLARPLARLLESQGNPVGSFEELAQSRSVALVMVTCVISRSGAKADDRFDVTVSAINNPRSLEGGELFLTPLRGPLPGQGVYAIASGPVIVEGANKAAGRVRGGARITTDIHMPVIHQDGSIVLIIRPAFSGWTTAQLLANTINQHRIGFDETTPDIAYALDDRSVRVQIPSEELADPANFLADIMSIRFDPSLLDLPSRVVINEREGVIVVSGNAQISPLSVSYGELMINTVNAAGGGQNGAGNGLDPLAQGASLQDLLEVFKTLGVPVKSQIAIISELHHSGRMHAELIIQ